MNPMFSFLRFKNIHIKYYHETEQFFFRAALDVSLVEAARLFPVSPKKQCNEIHSWNRGLIDCRCHTLRFGSAQHMGRTCPGLGTVCYWKWCVCGLFVTEGGVSADSDALLSSVTQVGNFGTKKRLNPFSLFRYWADGTQHGDSPPVNRCGCCNVSEGNFAWSSYVQFSAQS